jgi:protein SCO1/2
MIRRLLGCSILAVLALSGCRSAQSAGVQPVPVQTSANPTYKVYKLRGKVISTNAAKGEVNLDGEAVPGFMEAMTMPYKLKDPSLLNKLHQGDVITADVLAPQDSNADVLIDQIVVLAQPKPDHRPPSS